MYLHIPMRSKCSHVFIGMVQRTDNFIRVLSDGSYEFNLWFGVNLGHNWRLGQRASLGEHPFIIIGESPASARRYWNILNGK